MVLRPWGAAEQLDLAILLCRQAGFRRIYLRGDTDFTQTKQLDARDAEGVTFLFGIDAMANLKAIAEDLPISDWAELNSFSISSSLRMMRMPRPPPPAEAFTITGRPICRAHSRASSALAMMPSDPGRMGTLALFIACRAFSFSPIKRITSGGGPMNLIWLVSQTSAKLAFSLSRP